MDMRGIEILREDADIIVIYKPAGLAVQAAGVGQPDVASELKKYLHSSYLGIVHRLDQPVEGVLVFGKTKQAAARLTAALGNGTLNKRYYAVVCGKPAKERDRLVDELVKEGNVARVVGKAGDKSKQAILEYNILGTAEFSGVSAALADIRIETGRFHQIRVQMANAGLPLLGDVKYGTNESMDLSRKMRVACVALCAYRLDIVHPMSGEKLCFEVEPRGDIFRQFS